MKDLDRRYSVPISQARPKGARLLEGYSPKLQRSVQLFDYASFSIWIGLEADPSVVAFCERPARFGLANNDALIDFWVLGANAEESFRVLSNHPDVNLPVTLHEIAVHYVRDSDLAASQIWVSNWTRILGVINAARGVIEQAMLKSIQDFVQQPITLGRIEAQFSCGDPVPVRACVFELLRKGRLSAPRLHTQALTLHTTMEPLS